MRKLLITTIVILTLLMSGGVVSAGNGFRVTYPYDTDNLNLGVGSLENVEVHIMNNLGTSVTVGVSDNAGDKILVSYPTDFEMNPGEEKTVLLTIDPLSGGDFNVAVHVSARTPGGGGGGMGGQVFAGMDIPLKGSVESVAPPPEEEGPPWLGIVIVLIVAVGGAIVYFIKFHSSGETSQIPAANLGNFPK